MSVVIKGVNAPNNCYDCINSNDGEPFELLSNCPTFGDLCEGKITANELPKDKRSDFCPVKQLPTPHGRLIDADKAATSILMMNNHPCGNSIETINDVVEWLRFADENGNNVAFPTIIEAEVSE